MNENTEIQKIQAIYDPNTKEYVKAYLTVDGKTKVLTSDTEIKECLKQLQKQEGKPINKIGVDKKEVVFSTSPVAKDKEEAWDNASRILQGKVSRKNPHTGKKTKGIDKKNYSKFKKAIYSALLGVAALAVVSCGAGKIGDALTNKARSITDETSDEKLNQEIKDPESWDEYMTATYNPEAEQKVFAKYVMDNQIKPNIKTKTINDTSITYGLTPEQAMAFTLYYNSNLYSNEKMLAILGDYTITGNSDTSKNLINQVNDASEMIRLSWALADNKEEMIIPEVEDKVVQDLINKYVDLIVKYKNADTSKEKKSIKTEIETALKVDFIDEYASAEVEVINLQDHPAAHIILNTVPAVFSTMYDPLDEDINKIIVGTEANYDVDLGNGKSINIPETGGLVDQPCAIYIQRFDNFQEYRDKLEINKMLAESTNAAIYTNIEYLEEAIEEANKSIFTKSKVEDLQRDLEATRATLTANIWEEITVDTYEYDDHDEHKGQLIPWMEEAVLEYGLDNIENMQAMFREAAFAEFNARKSGGAFNPHSNPAGGKKGDTYVESEGRVPVSEEDLISKYQYDPAEKEAAEKKAAEEVGAVSKEEGEKEAGDVQQAINEMGRTPYYYFKENGPSAPDLEWASHSSEIVRSHYNTLKQQGIQAYNIEHAPAKEDNSDGDKTPEHGDNPNQNNEEKNPTPEEEENKDPTPTPNEEETNTPTPEEEEPTEDVYDDAPSHEDNPNQQNNSAKVESSNTDDHTISNNGSSSGNSSVDVVDSDVIEGTITTDDSGVWDPSTVEETVVVYNAAPTSENPAATVVVDTSLEEQIDQYIQELENYSASEQEEISYQKTL